MIFKSKRDLLFTSVFILIFIILSGIIFKTLHKENFETGDITSLCIVIGVFIVIAWGFKATSYEITKNQIKYKSGFINGAIDINNIQSITRNKTLWVGMKPALSRNGLIIKYNKYDVLYISPKTNTSFITEILKLNSSIIIINK